MRSSDGTGTLDEMMQVAIICDHMGWTYQQYDEQPDWLIAALRIKMREDNRFAKDSQPKVKGKYGQR